MTSFTTNMEPTTSHQCRSVKLLDSPIAGSGPCKACDCRGYKPNDPKNDYCKVCGHSWYMHKDASGSLHAHTASEHPEVMAVETLTA